MTVSIGFVILHYISIDDTIECVKSIIDNIDTNDYRIYIVDNASPNGSGIVLKKRYISIPNVIVKINPMNLGFSKGNNVGIRIALSDGCKFVVVLNNDVCLLQNNFYKLICQEYENSRFAILGPQVIDLQGSNKSNPIGQYTYPSLSIWNKGMIVSMKNYLKALLHINHISRKQSNSDERRKLDDLNHDERQDNVALHGCCWIFSHEYFKCYDGIEELTFMYGEETILVMNCIRARLRMVYNPSLKILHKEAISTNREFKSWKREIMYRKRMMQATLAICRKINREKMKGSVSVG